MNNLSLITYTHSKAKDLHCAYFGRIKKYFSDLKYNYVMCNEKVEYTDCIIYNDDDPHYKQMISVLDKIKTDYVIYSQEDYILFDYVKIDKIKNYLETMDNNPEIGFIRLIHSGLGNLLKFYSDELMVIDPNSEYYFSTQATIWKKNILKQMFELSQIQSIFDEPKNSPYLKQMNIIGLYPTNRGKQVGGHYNSYDYPYIATAKVKGQWNLNEYSEELNELFKEYDIKFNKPATNL